MIAPLRRRHRLLVTSLAVLLPVGLLAALGARLPEPVQASLPPEIAPASHPVGLEKRATLVLDSWALAFHGPDEGLWVTLEGEHGPARPDVLVMWSADGPTTDTLPEGARFLGTLGETERAYQLPDGWNGRLLLYSVAHAELVTALELPGRPLP